MKLGKQFTVWGEVLWDKFPTGSILGGAPSNTAYHLAQLGAATTLVSRVGTDPEGDRAIATLAAGGVDVRAIQRDPDRATGEVEVATVNGEPTYRLVANRAWEYIDNKPCAEVLANTDVFVYGTLSQRTDYGFAAFSRALTQLPAHCIRVCDPNLRPGHLDERALTLAVESAHILKLNDAEAGRIGARWTSESHHDSIIKSAINWLLQHTPTQLVAVTHGHKGSTLYARGMEPVFCPPHEAAEGGDNLGCGDAYLAAFLVEIQKDSLLEEVGDQANAYAAQIAGVRGSGVRAADSLG